MAWDVDVDCGLAGLLHVQRWVSRLHKNAPRTCRHRWPSRCFYQLRLCMDLSTWFSDVVSRNCGSRCLDQDNAINTWIAWTFSLSRGRRCVASLPPLAMPRRFRSGQHAEEESAPLLAGGSRLCLLSKLSAQVRRPEALLLLATTLEKLALGGVTVNIDFYLENWTKLREVQASVASFAIIGAAYLFAVFGGFLADSKIGRFSTYLASLVVQLAGSALVLLASLDVPNKARQALAISGLALVAIGLAGSCATVIPLGVDQYRLSGSGVVDATKFFPLYFWCSTLGTIIAFTAVSFVQVFNSYTFGLIPSVGCYFLCLLLVYTQRHRFHKTKANGSPLSSVAEVLAEGRRRRSGSHLAEKSSASPSAQSVQNLTTCTMRGDSLSATGWLDKCKTSFGGQCEDQLVEDVRMFGRVTLILLTLPFYMTVTQSVSWLAKEKCTCACASTHTILYMHAQYARAYAHALHIQTHTHTHTHTYTHTYTHRHTPSNTCTDTQI